MNQQIFVELRLSGAGFVTGLWLMAVYDVLRVLRIFVPHCPAAVGAEDVCYWIYAGLTAFSLVYRGNVGTVRAYIIAAAAAGMAIYDRLLSRRLLKLLQKLKKSVRIKRKKRKKLVDK